MASALSTDIQVQISGPAMAAALSLCAEEDANGYALWLGDEITTRSTIITDTNCDDSKEEKFIVLEAALPVKVTHLKSCNIKLTKNKKVVGLLRLRDSTVSTLTCDQPMAMDRKFIRTIRERLSPDNLSESKNLVFTVFTKVGKSTKVQNFITPGILNTSKYEPEIIRVVNLADGDAKIKRPATGNIAQWMPEPNVPDENVVDFVFAESRKCLEAMADKLARKKETKLELQKEIQRLVEQLENAKTSDNVKTKNGIASVNKNITSVNTPNDTAISDTKNDIASDNTANGIASQSAKIDIAINDIMNDIAINDIKNDIAINGTKRDTVSNDGESDVGRRSSSQLLPLDLSVSSGSFDSQSRGEVKSFATPNTKKTPRFTSESTSLSKPQSSAKRFRLSQIPTLSTSPRSVSPLAQSQKSSSSAFLTPNRLQTSSREAGFTPKSTRTQSSQESILTGSSPGLSGLFSQSPKNHFSPRPALITGDPQHAFIRLNEETAKRRRFAESKFESQSSQDMFADCDDSQVETEGGDFSRDVDPMVDANESDAEDGRRSPII